MLLRRATCRARAVSAKKGWASKKRVFGPTAGMAWLLRGGKKLTCKPMRSNRLRNWSSTTSAKVPTTIKAGAVSGALAGRPGTSAAKQASSPWVKVVSMPLPE